MFYYKIKLKIKFNTKFQIQLKYYLKLFQYRIIIFFFSKSISHLKSIRKKKKKTNMHLAFESFLMLASWPTCNGDHRDSLCGSPLFILCVFAVKSEPHVLLCFKMLFSLFQKFFFVFSCTVPSCSARFWIEARNFG